MLYSHIVRDFDLLTNNEGNTRSFPNIFWT